MASEHQMVQAKAKLPISVYNKLKSLKSNLHYGISKSNKETYLVSMTLDKYVDAGAFSICTFNSKECNRDSSLSC